MEQTRYWMWTRNKLVGEKVPSAVHVDHNYSWEEQAFAKDSADPLGGCIWPPRSYTCSFCRREFRSAQALGGHMNVHRRDRARLKQSPPPIPPPPSHHENNNIHQNPFTTSTSFMGTAIQHPSSHDQVCSSLVYSPSLMINNPNLVVASSPANRVSAASSSTQENCISTIQTLVSSSYTSSIVHNESLSPTTLTRSEPITSTARFLIVSADSSKLEVEDENLKKRETAAGILRRVHDQHKLINSSAAVSLNLVSYSRNRRPISSDDEGEDIEDDSMVSNKRRKTSNTPSTLPFFLKANFIDRDRLKSERIGLINKQISMEDELDLELRLGA